MDSIHIIAGMGTRRKSSRPRRDRDVGFTSRDETETRHCAISTNLVKFRDETETRRVGLYKFY